MVAASAVAEEEPARGCDTLRPPRDFGVAGWDLLTSMGRVAFSILNETEMGAGLRLPVATGVRACVEALVTGRPGDVLTRAGLVVSSERRKTVLGFTEPPDDDRLFDGRSSSSLSPSPARTGNGGCANGRPRLL